MRSINLSNLTQEQRQDILNGPALPPPPGVVPNFESPHNSDHIAIAVNVVSLMITILVVYLRAYAKIFCVKKLRLEDYLIVPALATFIASTVCELCLLTDIGLFIHQWDVRLRDLAKIYYIMHVGANLIAVTIMIIKGAILLEWIHIFVPPGTRNYFYWTSTVVLYLHTFFYTSWIITKNLSCVPFNRIWDITVTDGGCVEIKHLFLPSASVNLVANMIILFLPQRAIWTLQMSVKKKVGAALIFFIGSLASVSAGLRLRVTFIFYDSEDIVYTEAWMYLYCLTEMTCLFLVFCVPAIPRVFVELGMKTRVKNLLSRCTGRPVTAQTQESRDSSTSSASLAGRRAGANRPRSGSFVRPLGMNPYRYSVDEAWGPTTEITAVKHDDKDCEGMTGILRTREISTEVTDAAPAPAAAKGQIQFDDAEVAEKRE